MKYIAGIVAMLSLSLASPVWGQQAPILIGDISSYSALPSGTDGYRKGWQLAEEEINAAGGLLNGRKIQIIERDDAGKPEVATRVAEELLSNQKVEILMGTILSNIGVAVADFAARHKTFFLATQPLTDAIVWEKGNHYTFRLRPSTYTQTLVMVDEAAKLPAKRWATIAPNYEYGQSAVKSFKAALKAKRADVEFVSEQWPELGKLEAGSTVQAILAAKPDAIFNVTFGSDLARFVREGSTRGLFNNRPVVSLLTGEPEYLDPLKEDAPKGWIVTGYPWDQIKTPAHVKFVTAYERKYKESPKIGSLMGYIGTYAIAAIIKRAGSTDTEKLIAAARGIKFDSPMGPITFRAIDHQSTMGIYVGKIDVKNGHGVMVDWRYVDGKDYQASDSVVRARRPANADR